MGDPLPGQFPDNIFVSVQQVKMDGDQVGKAGDIITKDITTGFWKRAGAGDVDDIKGFGQSRVDFDTTNQPDGAVSIEAFAAPSYIYAYAGAAIKNGAGVQLNAAAVTPHDEGQTFIEAAVGNYGNGTVRGQFSRVATDSAGNNDAVAGDVIIVKLGVY